jgi:hypothetical protein
MRTITAATRTTAPVMSGSDESDVGGEFDGGAAVSLAANAAAVGLEVAGAMSATDAEFTVTLIAPTTGCPSPHTTR